MPGAWHNTGISGIIETRANNCVLKFLLSHDTEQRNADLALFTFENYKFNHIKYLFHEILSRLKELRNTARAYENIRKSGVL